MQNNASVSKRFVDWTRSPAPGTLTDFQRFTRNVDWEKSPLGPMDSWPNQLRQIVLVVVADPQPAVVLWGPEQAIVYNDAYTALIGNKHPYLQGKDPRVGGFAELWDPIDKVLKEGERTGETHVAARSMLPMHRYGYLEETYFSYKFIPLVDEEGYVIASYATVLESTREAINDRRMLWLQDISSRIPDTAHLNQFWPEFLGGLQSVDKDLPIAMAYHVQDAVQCSLAGTFGIAINHPFAPMQLLLNRRDHGLAAFVHKALRTGQPLLVNVEDKAFPTVLLEDIAWKGFGEPSTEFLICPIRGGELTTVLVLGLNPRKRYDADYQQFVNSVTSQLLRPHVQNIALAAEITTRKARAEQAHRDQATLSRQLLARTKESRASMKFTRFADEHQSVFASPISKVVYSMQIMPGQISPVSIPAT